MYRRLQSLRTQHRTLDTLIERELVRPAHDAMHVRSLKKIRLRLRDEIARVEALVRGNSDVAA